MRVEFGASKINHAELGMLASIADKFRHGPYHPYFKQFEGGAELAALRKAYTAITLGASQTNPFWRNYFSNEMREALTGFSHQ